MATDWTLVREVMDAAIDACEAAERLQLDEADRELPTGTGEVVVWEVLTSAWTYPENVRYAVLRARTRLDDDAPYHPELGRVLREAAGVCAELVGARRLDEPVPAGEGAEPRPTIRRLVRGLASWYRAQMVPQLERAAALKQGGG